ncbi:MAG: ROK family protein [Planctomycetota bacterium]
MVLADPDFLILEALHRHGPLSRQQLHTRTGLRPNTVGDAAGRLLGLGVLSEGVPQAVGPGRPRVPLRIDDGRRWVVGLALTPGRVTGCRVSLTGRRVGRLLDRAVPRGVSVTEEAAALLPRLVGPEAVGVGVTTTGLLDAESRTILFSSAVPDRRPLSAAPIYDAAGDLPLRFDNDMRALAAQWQLTHPGDAPEDLLLVLLRDGAIGASLLIAGRPNRGCVVGGNELGQTHLPVDGGPRRLEDLFSSTHLAWLDPSYAARHGDDLDRRAAAADPDDDALWRVTDLLGLGLANAVNLVRPHRLVLVGELTRHTRFLHRLADAVRQTTLGPVAERMRIDTWDAAVPPPAESAAWLALDHLFRRDGSARVREAASG